MAQICRNCHADCTDDIAIALLPQRFRCKCGCGVFLDRPDAPKVDYELTRNDALFLRRLSIERD